MYGKLDRPTFYIDHINYQKALGYRHRDQGANELNESYYGWVDYLQGNYFGSRRTYSFEIPGVGYATEIPGSVLETNGTIDPNIWGLSGRNEQWEFGLSDNLEEICHKFGFYHHTIPFPNASNPLARDVAMHRVNWFGIFNHNFHSADLRIDFRFRHYAEEYTEDQDYLLYNINTINSLCNYPSDLRYKYNGMTLISAPPYNEFFVPEGDDVDDGIGIDALGFEAYYDNQYAGSNGVWDNPERFKIGFIGYGHKYIMPIGCEVTNKQSRTFDGIKSYKNLGGVGYSRLDYMNNRSWADLTNFDTMNDDLHSTNPEYAQQSPHGTVTDRKRWNMKFRHISERDIYPDTEGYTQSNIVPGVYFDQLNISQQNFDVDITDISAYEENSFISQVLNYTLGGRLKFGFTPTSDINSTNLYETVNSVVPGDFYICKFDMNTFEVVNTGPNTYEISIDIVESL